MNRNVYVLHSHQIHLSSKEAFKRHRIHVVWTCMLYENCRIWNLPDKMRYNRCTCSQHMSVSPGNINERWTINLCKTGLENISASSNSSTHPVSGATLAASQPADHSSFTHIAYLLWHCCVFKVLFTTHQHIQKTFCLSSKASITGREKRYLIDMPLLSKMLNT